MVIFTSLVIIAQFPIIIVICDIIAGELLLLNTNVSAIENYCK